MSVIEMGAQPSRRHGRLQAVRAAVSVWALASLGLLSGCASMNPVNWFHSAEGGVIAKPHQPPPGQNQPYPNLATVPPTPPAPDMAALQHITDALIADRTNAQHLAAAAPLADPSSPTTSPDLFGIGSVPPPGPPPPPGAPAASASLPAATAPPAPAAAPAALPAPAAAQQKTTAAAAPPQKAPVGAVQSASLPDIATATQAPPGNVGPQPPIPAAPPPAPALAGVATPPAVPSPAAATAKVNATAAPPPPAAAPQPPPNPATTVLIEFAPASSSVPAASLPALKALAAKRGGHVIEALGRGDASSSDPAAQQQAVTLGFARAQAIAAALAASGVPRGAIQVMALAAGSGGLAQLVE